MARITWLGGFRHLRAEPTSHVLLYKRGRLVRSGRGISFWFWPLTTSLAEVPCDDRDQPFLFHERSRDFQDVTVQGVVTYRVVDPETVAGRIDFSIDPSRGHWTTDPLEKLSASLTRAAQQHALDHVVRSSVRELVSEGAEELRDRVGRGLREDENIAAMGLEIVALRISGVAPTSELERALQAPAAEAIQQEADEAAFQRRALAVEKERAIQENELQNRIELARREESLIAQEGANSRHRAEEDAAAARIEVEAASERQRLEASARADGIRTVESARVEAERERMDIHRDLPPHVLLGLAAQQLAGKLRSIEHLNLSPDSLSPILASLAAAGTKRLKGD